MTPHPIPSSFRLRRRKWKVVTKERGDRANHAGLCAPASKQIVLYDKTHNRERTQQERQRTFWHEVTHAVLLTMHHKLGQDEVFVTHFGLLLEELIRTARFEEGTQP
jgi:hypothetical protein